MDTCCRFSFVLAGRLIFVTANNNKAFTVPQIYKQLQQTPSPLNPLSQLSSTRCMAMASDDGLLHRATPSPRFWLSGAMSLYIYSVNMHIEVCLQLNIQIDLKGIYIL